MAKTTVDEILIKIKGDMAHLERELKKVKNTSNNTSKNIQGNFDNINKKVTASVKKFALLGAGIGAVFGGIAIKKIINVGMSIETLQIRLNNLFGSVEEGAKAFDEMSKFASKVPFSLADIQQGAGALAAVASDSEELAKILKITGNAAAATGLDFASTSMQIQRTFSAGLGSADLFRERAISSFLGIQQGTEMTVAETIKLFEDTFGDGGKFGQLTDKLASTLGGTLSMIGDKVFNFQRLLGDERFFSEVQGRFEELDNFLADNQEQFNELAKTISIGLADALTGLVNLLKFARENSDTLKTALELLVIAFVSMKIVGVINTLLIAYRSATLGAAMATGKFNKALLKNPLIFLGTSVVLGLANFRKELGLVSDEVDKVTKKVEENPFLSGSQRGMQNRREQGLGVSPVNNSGEQDTLNKRLLIEKQIRTSKSIEGKSDFQKMKEEIELNIKLLQTEEGLQKVLLEKMAGSELQGKQKQAMIDLLTKEFNVSEQIRLAEEEKKKTEKDNDKRTKEREALQAKFNSTLESTRTQQEALNAEIAEFKNLAVELGQENLPEFQIALERMEHELAMLDPLTKTLHDTFERAFEGIGRSITDAMVSGGNAMDNLKSVAKNVVDELLNEFFRLQVIIPLKNALFGGGSSGVMGGSIMSGLGGIFSGAFSGISNFFSSPASVGGSFAGNASQINVGGGAFNTAGGGMVFRAGGGAIQRGMPTVVGERGAELFIPNTSGRIVNNAGSRGMMGGQTVINQNLNVNAGVAQTVRAEMLNLLPAFKQETIAAVAETRLRGGEFASAFSGGK